MLRTRARRYKVGFKWTRGRRHHPSAWAIVCTRIYIVAYRFHIRSGPSLPSQFTLAAFILCANCLRIIPSSALEHSGRTEVVECSHGFSTRIIIYWLESDYNAIGLLKSLRYFKMQRIRSCGTDCRAGNIAGEIPNVVESTESRTEGGTNGFACGKCTHSLYSEGDVKWRTKSYHKNIESQCQRQCTNGSAIFPAAATHISLCSIIYSIRYSTADSEESSHCAELQNIGRFIVSA